MIRKVWKQYHNLYYVSYCFYVVPEIIPFKINEFRYRLEPFESYDDFIQNIDNLKIVNKNYREVFGTYLSCDRYGITTNLVGNYSFLTSCSQIYLSYRSLEYVGLYQDIVKCGDGSVGSSEKLNKDLENKKVYKYCYSYYFHLVDCLKFYELYMKKIFDFLGIKYNGKCNLDIQFELLAEYFGIDINKCKNSEFNFYDCIVNEISLVLNSYYFKSYTNIYRYLNGYRRIDNLFGIDIYTLYGDNLCLLFEVHIKRLFKILGIKE